MIFIKSMVSLSVVLFSKLSLHLLIKRWVGKIMKLQLNHFCIDNIKGNLKTEEIWKLTNDRKYQTRFTLTKLSSAWKNDRKESFITGTSWKSNLKLGNAGNREYNYWCWQRISENFLKDASREAWKIQRRNIQRKYATGDKTE
jgi:hypothetical protein